jgi:hypothetical protein
MVSGQLRIEARTVRPTSWTMCSIFTSLPLLTERSDKVTFCQPRPAVPGSAAGFLFQQLRSGAGAPVPRGLRLPRWGPSVWYLNPQRGTQGCFRDSLSLSSAVNHPTEKLSNLPFFTLSINAVHSVRVYDRTGPSGYFRVSNDDCVVLTGHLNTSWQHLYWQSAIGFEWVAHSRLIPFSSFASLDIGPGFQLSPS